MKLQPIRINGSRNRDTITISPLTKDSIECNALLVLIIDQTRHRPRSLKVVNEPLSAVATINTFSYYQFNLISYLTLQILFSCTPQQGFLNSGEGPAGGRLRASNRVQMTREK